LYWAENSAVNNAITCYDQGSKNLGFLEKFCLEFVSSLLRTLKS